MLFGAKDKYVCSCAYLAVLSNRGKDLMFVLIGFYSIACTLAVLSRRQWQVIKHAHKQVTQ